MYPAVQHWLPKPISQTIFSVVSSILTQSLSLVTPRGCQPLYYDEHIVFTNQAILWSTLGTLQVQFFALYNYLAHLYRNMDIVLMKYIFLKVYHWSGFKLHEVQYHHFIFLSLTHKLERHKALNNFFFVVRFDIN